MKKLLAALLSICGTAVLSGAQTVIRNEHISKEDRTVTVTFELDTDDTDIPSRRKEVILPYIYNDKDTLYLDVVEVYGKGRYKRERQVNALKGDRDWDLSEGQTMKRSGVYSYISQVPLKRWMTVANLGIRRQMVGCACEKDISDENIGQAELFEIPQVQRRLPSFVLAESAGLWDFGQDELEIIFKVSRADIDSSVFNNEITFGKILDAVDRIYSYPDLRLEKIEVAGYASPEGPPEFNTWLGEARANALIDYIIKHRPQYGITPDHFQIRNGEENWEGLRRVVAASEMDRREEVLAIIDNDSIPSERRKLWIEKLDHGWVWKRMLDEIYPHLRCARYLAVYYESSDDRVVEALEQANSLVNEGRYADAYEILIPHGTDPRAFNTIGVCLMMQKKFEEAMPWLQKALESGCLAAQKNVAAIEDEYLYEEQQRREIEKYLNKLN